MNTLAHGRTGIPSDRFDATPARPLRHLGIVVLFFGVALLAGSFAVPLNRGDAISPAELAERCRDWDAKALAAMERRAQGPEIGKQVYMRTAMMWLAEARRCCEAGSDARAGRFYQRIVGRAAVKATPAVAGR